MRLSVGVAQALAGAAAGGLSAEKQAQKLARAAVYLMNHHQQRLNKPAPAVRRRGRVRYTGASASGEYPRKRTGFLQANVMFRPSTIAEIIRQGMIRVGLMANAFYGAVLEVRYHRLGLRRTLSDLLPQLRALAGQNLRYQVVDRFVDQ
jgi:hypothetical protein